MKNWLFSKASMTFFICLLSVSFLAAQTVSGELKDADGEPLIGASVVVQGTNSGTITDIDGMYSIQASPGDVLLISYIGYRDQTITVGDDSNVSLVLESDSEILDEVVVVGYGTRKKSHNTGAISQIGGTEIAAIQAARVDDALAGKLAGVLIQNQDGAPGADPKIQVRAANSISGASQPLIVVDGFPISGNLATVNPNDIQSLEVLKDAASSAIYGSRGANGVILITTKKGKSGKAKISYNAYVSTSHRYRDDVEQLKTAGEWADILDAGIADGTYDVSETDPRLVDFRINAFRNAPDVVAVEDWLFRDGNSTAHDFSVSGGNDDVSYFASAGYQNTDGVVITQGFEKFNARLNVDAKLGKRFKTGLNINGFYGDRGSEKLTEHSPVGEGFMADCCQQWEDSASELKNIVDRLIINRIGIVLSTKGGALPKILMTKAIGVYNYFGSGSQYYSWIHIDDLCRVFLKNITDRTISGIYNAVAPEPLTNKDFTITIKDTLGGIAAMPAPKFGLRLLLGEMADVVLNSNRVYSTQLEKENFHYDYSDLGLAVQDLLERKV